MKNLILCITVIGILISCRNKQGIGCSATDNQITQFIDTAEMTNNFYDNTETFPLPVKDIMIDGEISNPGRVNFSKLVKHSVIVKETLLDSAGSDSFTGAYRYDGYSLFDILEHTVPAKLNSSEFRPVIDLYIEIENDRGAKVVFSWGEIYYPNNLHKIIIATGVSRIVPTKTKDLWPLPSENRIVAGCDLVTERNISSPVRITVRSFPHSFRIDKSMTVMYSGEIKVFKFSEQAGMIKDIPAEETDFTYNTVFYGRGKGIHSTTPFTGILLKDLLQDIFPVSRDNLQRGIFCLAGIDGYRCSVSYTEIFNRNDQEEFLLVRTNPGEDGGLYRLFAAADFFSDRAVKSLNEIRFIY